MKQDEFIVNKWNTFPLGEVRELERKYPFKRFAIVKDFGASYYQICGYNHYLNISNSVNLHYATRTKKSFQEGSEKV